MKTVRPIKDKPVPGVPRISPIALTTERLREAMDRVGAKTNPSTRAIDLLTRRR